MDRLGLASAQAPVGAHGDDRGDDARQGRARLRRDAPRPRAGRGGRGRRGEPRLGDQRLAPDHLRLRQDLHLLHRPVQPGPGAQPAVRRDRRRGARPRGPGLPRGHPARPERQQLWPRPAGRGALRPRQHGADRGPAPGPRGAPGPGGADPRDRRPANGRWRPRHPAPAVRDVAPVGPLGPPDRGAGGLPQRLRVAPPAGPVRLGFDAPAHGPPVHDRALPRAPGPDPRGRARHLALDRRDRGLLRRDRGRVRGHARPPAHGPLRPGLRGGVQRAARHAGHEARRRRPGGREAPPAGRAPRRPGGDRPGAEPRLAGPDDRGPGRRDRPAADPRPRRARRGRPRPRSTAPRRRETPSRDCRRASSTSSGRSRENKLVHVAGSPALLGHEVAVAIDHAGPYALRGRLA